MLALMQTYTIPSAELSLGHGSVTAITSNANSAWRRFLDAFLLAFSAPAV